MKLKIRKILSVFLVFAMMIGMMPNIVTDVHAATIKDIDVNITEPVVGQYPDRKGTVNNSGQYYVKCVNWYDAETNGSVGGTFLSGRTYIAEVVLRTNGDHHFVDEGINLLKINGKYIPPVVSSFEHEYLGDYGGIRIDVFYTIDRKSVV